MEENFHPLGIFSPLEFGRCFWVLIQGGPRSVLAQIWALYSKWITAYLSNTLEGLLGGFGVEVTSSSHLRLIDISDALCDFKLDSNEKEEEDLRKGFFKVISLKSIHPQTRQLNLMTRITAYLSNTLEGLLGAFGVEVTPASVLKVVSLKSIHPQTPQASERRR